MPPRALCAWRYRRYLAWIVVLGLLLAITACSLTTEYARAPDITPVSPLAAEPALSDTAISTMTPADATATATYAPAARPTDTPAPSPVVTAPPQAEASPCWQPYTAGAQHFSVAVPGRWEILMELSTGVLFQSHHNQTIMIEVFDFMPMGRFDDPASLAWSAETLEIANQAGTIHAEIISRSLRIEPMPMLYIEALLENPRMNGVEYQTLIYLTPGEDWSVLAQIIRWDAPPEEQEIDALLATIASLTYTPADRVAFLPYPDDVDDPDRWANYYGNGFTLRHPSSWPIVAEHELWIDLISIPQGQITLVIDRVSCECDLVGDEALIDDLLSWLVVTDGWSALKQAEVLDRGSRLEPLPMNYMELSVTNAVGARGHRVYIQADLGDGAFAYAVLVRDLGLFAPGELEALYTLLTTIVVDRPPPHNQRGTGLLPPLCTN